jgi:hypothetical protein
MQNLFSIFNSRELAILTLVFAGILVAVFFKQPRSLVWDFLKIVFSLLKMRLYVLMLVYVAAWVFLFYKLELWELGLLKDTIKWLIFAGTVTFVHFQKFQEDSKEYMKVFKEVFTFSILLEFFTDKFTFGYWAELVIIPVFLFVGLVRLFTEKDKKYRSADKVFQRFLFLGGALFLIHLVLHGIKEFKSWFTIESLKEFLLPIVLSVILMPYIFALSVYAVYQWQFKVLERKLGEPGLLGYAKWKAFGNFFWHYKDMRRWVLRLKFEKIQTMAELDKSIKALRQTQRNEKEGVLVDHKDCWSPYEAIRFLEPDFKTGVYDPRFDDKWMADSNFVYVGNDRNSNHFWFKIIGLELEAHHLELELNLQTPAEKGRAYELLGSYGVELFVKATGSALPDKYLDKLFEGKPFSFNHGGTRVRLQRNDWPNHLNHGYDLVLTLRRGDTRGYD